MKKALILISFFFFLAAPVFCQLSATPQVIALDATFPSTVSLTVSTTALTFPIPSVYPGTPTWYSTPTFTLDATMNIPTTEYCELYYQRTAPFDEVSDITQAIPGATHAKCVADAGMPTFIEDFLPAGMILMEGNLTADVSATLHFEVQWENGVVPPSPGTYTTEVTFTLIAPNL